MDPSKSRRPGTQTPRQIPKLTFGNPQPVPKAMLPRPRIGDVNARNAVISRESMDRMRARPHAPPALRQGQGTAPPVVSQVSAAKTLPALAVAAVVSPVAPVSQAPQAARLAQKTPLDMELPGEESPSRLGALFANTRWQNVRRKAFRGAAVAMVLLITLGGLLFSQGYLNLHKIFKGGAGTAAALKPNVNPDLLKGEGSGRVNILLMGRGGGGHEAPDLTDTMMIASIDPINHTSTLVSLPRDLWVNVPQEGVMKLNAVWETGEFKYLGKEKSGSSDPKAIRAGFDMVDQTVSDVLGIDIHYNVIVNFQAFQQAVNTVNGVTVNVPANLVDPTMAWENNNNPVLAKAGVQHFDGARALRYVRSRETSSDFARAERQRAVLVALKSKIVSIGTLSNPAKIAKLTNSFGNNVSTDLSLSNAQRLYKLTRNIGAAAITSVGLDNGNNPYVATGNINGQSVVLPKAGLFKYDDIHRFIRLKLKDPFIIKEKAKILVLNGTLLPDLATNKAKELGTYGYNVTGVGNTPSPGWTKTQLIDLSHGKKKYTKHYLEQRIGVSASTVMPDNTIQTNGANFVIILGSDEAPTQP